MEPRICNPTLTVKMGYSGHVQLSKAAVLVLKQGEQMLFRHASCGGDKATRDSIGSDVTELSSLPQLIDNLQCRGGQRVRHRHADLRSFGILGAARREPIGEAVPPLLSFQCVVLLPRNEEERKNCKLPRSGYFR